MTPRPRSPVRPWLAGRVVRGSTPLPDDITITVTITITLTITNTLTMTITTTITITIIITIAITITITILDYTILQKDSLIPLRCAYTYV